MSHPTVFRCPATTWPLGPAYDRGHDEPHQDVGTEHDAQRQRQVLAVGMLEKGHPRRGYEAETHDAIPAREEEPRFLRHHFCWAQRNVGGILLFWVVEYKKKIHNMCCQNWDPIGQ